MTTEKAESAPRGWTPDRVYIAWLLFITIAVGASVANNKWSERLASPTAIKEATGDGCVKAAAATRLDKGMPLSNGDLDRLKGQCAKESADRAEEAKAQSLAHTQRNAMAQ